MSSGDSDPSSSASSASSVDYKQIFSSGFETFLSAFLGPLEESGERNPTVLNQFALAALMIIVIISVYSLINYFVGVTLNAKNSSPYIVETIKDASKTLTILQDPKQTGSILLRRSLNENNGIEFSYLLWIYIADYAYLYGEPKFVFVKGSRASGGGFQTICPAVVLDPTENKLRVLMNTYSDPMVGTVIDNIPVAKWFHLALVLKDRDFDIYINGLLKKRMQLPSLPRQNFGNLVLNDKGGFSGYISKMRYHDYAVSNTEIETAVAYGPSTAMPMNTMQQPPYLNSNWWF